MTLIKSHSCTKCGGVLIVHNDKQKYECPYCGIFYDYEYFRSRDILEQAVASQKMLQYDSAKEKYDFILKKDPHNFTALRGNLLCEAKINRPVDLSNPERVVRIIPSSLKDAEEMADKDGKAYFHRLALLRELATFIRGNKQQKINLESGSVKIFSTSVAIPLNKAQRSGELFSVNRRLSKFNSEFGKLYTQLQELEPSDVKEEAKRQSSEKEADYGKENQFLMKIAPSCTSCGGEVIVNLNRQVYECPFCGLTFDYDIIRDETALSEVKDAIQKKQYIKADAIYEHILAGNPSNYEALRGRILCAAKCDDLQSIMETPELLVQKAYIPALKARVEEAVAACEDCDRPYFEEFKKTIPDFEFFNVNSNPSNVHRTKKSSLLKEKKQKEKEYENTKKGYQVLYIKTGGEKGMGPVVELTPQEAARMLDLEAKMKKLERELEDNQALLYKCDEEIYALEQNIVYAIGNIRQHLANLIRLEWVRNGEEKAVDLSGFHDAEWDEE